MKQDVLIRSGERSNGGLLLSFILDKLARYEEPERKGTPRGEKIGFPRKKYFASMLVGLTNRKLKDIAQDHDISYGLLRKWNSERDFQKAADEHCREFAGNVIAYIKKEQENFSKATADYFDERTDLIPSHPGFNEAVKDARFLSKKVLSELESARDKAFMEANKVRHERGELSRETVLKVNIHKIADLLIGHAKGELHKEIRERIVSECLKMMVKSAMELNQKRSRSESDQRMVDAVLSNVYDYLKRTTEETW